MCKNCDETASKIDSLIESYQKDIKRLKEFSRICRNEYDEVAYTSKIDTMEEIIYDLSGVNSRIYLDK